MRRYVLPLLAFAPVALALFWFLSPEPARDPPQRRPAAARAAPDAERIADAAPDARAHLEGRVLDAGGRPVAGAEVRVLEGELVVVTTRSSDDGAWRLGNLPAAEYVLLARRGDAASAPLGPIPLLPGESLHGLDLQLDAAASIAGTVRDAATGATIEGARIEIAGLAQVADRAGRFRIAGLPEGPAVLHASAPGYQVRTQPLELAGVMSGVEIGLRRGASVSGRVLGAEGPVAGATVRAVGAPGEVASDAGGAFTLDVPAGPVELEAIARDGSRGRAAPIELGPGVHADGVEIRVERAAELAGVVFDAAGAPAAGAEVHASSLDGVALAHGRTGADGRFSLGGLPGGLLRVVARHGAASGTAGPVAVGGLELLEVEVRLGAGTITGRVENTAGAGLAGARIVAWPDGTPRSAATRALAGEGGAFRFEGLPEGPLRVEAEHGDGVAVARGVFAGATDVRLVIGSGALVGRVLVDGRPATDFQVAAAAIDPGRTAGASRSMLAADGTFRLQLPPGRYEVRAAAGGVAGTQSAEVPGAGDSAELLFDLQSGAAIEGVVLDAATRAPIAGVRISTSRTGTYAFGQSAPVPAGPQAATGPDGAFRLAGLPTDRRVPVFAWKPGYQPTRPLVVQPTSGASERVEILLEPGGAGESAFGGIGLTLGRWQGALVAAEVIEGGPAWGAGIRRGDRIVAVEGAAVGPDDLRSVVDRVRGPVGTAVVLDLVRDGTWFRAAPLRAELRF